MLLRTSGPTPAPDNASTREDAALILTNAIREGNMPPADSSYLAQVVAARTGLSAPEAEKRVNEVYAQAQQNADTIRKAVAHSMYWTFLALLIGAFCASFAATIGGRQRDSVVVI
jgi:hypothetical protein